MNDRVARRMSGVGVPWGSLCALLCGGCLSTAWQGGGEGAIGLSPVELSAELGSGLPLHRASANVGGSLIATGDGYEGDQAVQVITNSGWRMGALFLLGENRRLPEMRDELKMGNDMFTAWGYQFEIQYGLAGSTVGLVDIVPLLMGLDQSMLIPAINVLVGLRFPNGIAFGIGPHFSPRGVLEPYFVDDNGDRDELHVDGLGLAAAIGYWFRKPGGVNMSVDLSAMQAGDISAIGVTFGWNFAK